MGTCFQDQEGGAVPAVLHFCLLLGFVAPEGEEEDGEETMAQPSTGPFSGDGWMG